MSSTPAASRATRRGVQFRKLGKNALLWLTLVVVFLAFEVTTRNLPPDGMTVTSMRTGDLPDPTLVAVATTTRYSGAQYQAVINQLYDDFNTASLSCPLYDPTMPICGPLSVDRLSGHLHLAWPAGRSVVEPRELS